jgi:putative NADH-flavin reductase
VRAFPGFLLVLAAMASAACTGAARSGKPQRVALIGATASSAPAFINDAIARGYEVVGIARRPEAVEVQSEHLTVFKGDVYDQKSLEAALRGDEVVVSYLSCCSSADPNDELREEIDLFSKGTWNIIQAMKAKGNRRLIAVSTTGVEHVYVDKPAADAPLLDKLLWNRRRKYDDTRRMEAIIVESGLEYIIVRPARVIGDKPVGTFNVAVNKVTYDPARRTLSRPDLARFILDNVRSTRYINSVVGVYN